MRTQAAVQAPEPEPARGSAIIGMINKEMGISQEEEFESGF